MSGLSEASLPTTMYNKLSVERQQDFNKAVVEKLRMLIGVSGELTVLAEYIAVMLQASRPPEQIQSELEAFLQSESGPFTQWLCDQLVEFDRKVANAHQESHGEALLIRAVRDARASGTRRDVDRERKPRQDRQDKEKSERDRKQASKESKVDREEAPRSRTRSKQRARRRQGSSGRSREAEKKAVLTPNVTYLRSAYHDGHRDRPDPVQSGSGVSSVPSAPQNLALALSDPVDTRWHFRADPGPGPAQAPLADARLYWPVPDSRAPDLARVRHHHRNFVPKKWRVIRPDTQVRATMHLDSEKVQFLQENEIVEQTAPQVVISGIVRIMIRHPSSPQFPSAIGWVTQDASAAGGPKFLEPGPEPMVRPSWRPWTAPPAERYVRPTPRGPNGFQNLTWTPSGTTA
uniref:PWI domain-containing protein n=1 Tax=Noctiluca scintillans TaxID=2966 RepID=A0A7S0ZMN3_NOCSC|mmetsp:Transcript_11375/g.31784  ORF Transcript_11375/g.31784 Transcript_11375/m.31784 type:complete len:404 (+) Transcript_11375:60-1271(+)